MDGVNYAGRAMPLSYADFTALEGLPARFYTSEVTFQADGQTLKTITVNYGGRLSPTSSRAPRAGGAVPPPGGGVLTRTISPAASPFTQSIRPSSPPYSTGEGPAPPAGRRQLLPPTPHFSWRTGRPTPISFPRGTACGRHTAMRFPAGTRGGGHPARPLRRRQVQGLGILQDGAWPAPPPPRTAATWSSRPLLRHAAGPGSR